MMTIGKVALQAGMTTDAVRYYEQEGLIQPTAKSGSGYRLYNVDAVRRLGFIRHAQQCGFTLAEIRELLTLRGSSSACCSDVRKFALEKKLQLEAKIKAMKVMSKALDQLIATCTDDDNRVDDCPILTALDQLRDQRGNAQA